MTKEEAISKVEGYLTDWMPLEQYDKVEEIIKALEQEPEIGYWQKINNMYGKYRCSNCKEPSQLEHNFCPNCGRKMIAPPAESEEI